MFTLRQTVNSDNLPLNPDVAIMLRVYTIEKHSKRMCVLGSCLFGPFSDKSGKQARLRVGGHQIRLRHGVLDSDVPLEHTLSSDMDENPVIPGVTILVRVLPHQKEYVAATEYETNCYRSEQAKPNGSENKLYAYYQRSSDIAMTVRDSAMISTGQASTSDIALEQLLKQQLYKEGADIEDFPFQRYVRYDPKQGMMVLIDKASGLPLFLEGRYLQCLAQVSPGEDSKRSDGKSQVISFLTSNLELESSQRAPDWSDSPKKVHPEYDDRAFMLLTLYGLRPRFDSNLQKLVNKDGGELTFNLQQAVAWAVVPCFDKGSVYAGIHHVPLLKGRPTDDILAKLAYLPLEYLCKEFKSQLKIFETASIGIFIWDGHFTHNECPPLPVHTNSLNISSNPNKYLKAAQQKYGPTVADLIKEGMKDPSQFNTQKSKMTELLSEAFKHNLDSSLVQSGYLATIQ